MQTGLEMLNNVQAIDGDIIRFIAEDGREMFEVRAGQDGISIEVRAVQNCRVGGELMDDTIVIRPICSNSIRISVPKYSDK